MNTTPPVLTDDSPPLSIAEAAVKLGISKRFANKLIAQNRFPVRTVMIGSRRKVMPSEIARFKSTSMPFVPDSDVEAAG